MLQMNFITRYTFFIWLKGLLFLCGLSECLTKIEVEFGQNVTLNCSLAEEEIYWFIQRQSEPPVYILRSFGSAPLVAIFNLQHREFRNKYSLQTSSRLSIHNVTRNELGIYYCVKVKEYLIFSNGTRLTRGNVSTPTNHPGVDHQLHGEDYVKSWMVLPFVVSCFFNCVFVILLLVVVIRCSSQKKKNTSVEQPPLSDPPMYSEIVLPTPSRTAPTRNNDSTYALIQLPVMGLRDTQTLK